MESAVHRCDRCGVTSDLAAGFARRLTLSGRRIQCVACQRRGGRGSAGVLVTLVLASPLVLVVRELAVMGRLDVVWQQPGWLVAAAAELYRNWAVSALGHAHLWAAAVLVVLLVHEAGHAVAARLVGDEVAEISLGTGPVVVRARLGGTRLVLRMLPLMGHTLIVPAGGAGARRRQALSVAAGPLAHAGVVAAAVLAGPASGAARHVAWVGGVSLVLNLVPHRAGGQANDGLQLLDLVRGPSPDGTAALAGRAYSRAVAFHLDRDLEEAQRECERGLAGHPGDTATEALLVAVLLERDQPAEARRRALRLLTEDLPPVRRATTECNLAYADLLLGTPDLVPEAAEAAARAHATLPWEPAVRATRAYVAIAQGRVDEGMALASQALDAEDNPCQRAGMLAVRAMGYAGSGRFREAQADVRAAARLQPDDVLVPRAAAEIERCLRVAAGDGTALTGVPPRGIVDPEAGPSGPDRRWPDARDEAPGRG